MHDVRVGRIVRALRRRRRWRQADLASRAGIGQTTVSVIERGHLEGTSLAILRRVFGALDAAIDLEPRWRGGALDRLVDERLAALVGFVVRHLRASGWETAVEVAFAVHSKRGAIDALAIRSATQAGGRHAPTRHRREPPGHQRDPARHKRDAPGHQGGRATALVVEVKTDLTSVEAMLRTLDVKVRLAPDLVVARFDGLWLVSPSSLRAVRSDSVAPQRVSPRLSRTATHVSGNTSRTRAASVGSESVERHGRRWVTKP